MSESECVCGGGGGGGGGGEGVVSVNANVTSTFVHMGSLTVAMTLPMNALRDEPRSLSSPSPL